MSFCFLTIKTATARKYQHQRSPPAIHHAAKKAKHLEVFTLAELFVNNVSIRFPAGVDDDNIRGKGTTIFATMQRVDPGLILLPLKKGSDLPPILSSSSFPTKYNLL